MPKNLDVQALNAVRRPDGQFPYYAWPGGYPLFYVNYRGQVHCPECMNGVTQSDMQWFAPWAYDINFDDTQLYCDGCGQRIPSAYAEDDENGEVD